MRIKVGGEYLFYEPKKRSMDEKIIEIADRQEYLAILGHILCGINTLETYSEMDHKTIVNIAIEQCDLVFEMLDERENGTK